MKKKKRRNIIIIFVLILVIFSSLFYFLNDENDNFIFRTLKNVTNTTSKIIYYPYNKIRGKGNVKDIRVLEAENKDLKHELDSYKKELDIKKALSDKTIVNAVVIKRSTSFWYNTITLDKGEKDKIQKGNAVMNSGGVIGKIIRVNKNSSEVKLITSNSSKNLISASFEYKDNIYYGLIDKYDIKKNELHLKNVIGDFNDDINNTLVSTSGLSDSFTSGLLIGKIKRVKKEEYGISNDIYITPTSNFNDMKIVSVIVR